MTKIYYLVIYHHRQYTGFKPVRGVESHIRNREFYHSAIEMEVLTKCNYLTQSALENTHFPHPPYSDGIGEHFWEV